jgi:hypothetical protein
MGSSKISLSTVITEVDMVVLRGQEMESGIELINLMG